MPDNEEKSKPSGPGLKGLVKGAAIVAVLVLVELVAAALLLPSAHDTEQLAQEMAMAAKGEDLLVDEEYDQSELEAVIGETVEVMLVADNITRFDPGADKTLNVTFTIYAVVLEEEEGEFVSEFAANENRIREQIVMTLHSAKTTDLTMPGLGLIKRQILEKTNRALGKPYLHDVIFTKINFVER